MPAPRLAPLAQETSPDLREQFDVMAKRMGFVPNSVLIMQRNPNMVRAFVQMATAIWAPGGQVDVRFKRLISHVTSRAAGCQYCMAHTAEGAARLGVEQQKIDAVWDYQTSPLFNAAERAALDIAAAAGCVPNAVTDDMFSELRKHWSEEQIVEIVGVIAMFGFLNRWNDTFATPLEASPIEFGEKHLAAQGWDAAKHMRA
jgi:uncharacterized peroxidase-related enzyme